VKSPKNQRPSPGRIGIRQKSWMNLYADRRQFQVDKSQESKPRPREAALRHCSRSFQARGIFELLTTAPERPDVTFGQLKTAHGLFSNDPRYAIETTLICRLAMQSDSGLLRLASPVASVAWTPAADLTGC
jgi:hypothetical protein